MQALVLALMFLLALYGIGKMVKRLFPVFGRLYFPSALIAGCFGLLLVYQSAWLVPIIPEVVVEQWSSWPAVLINVIFACLFLGKKILSPRETWHLAGPQVIFGQTLAWGQYVVGILLTMLVLTPVFQMSPLTGALIEISFEGGHGTAAGLAPLFNELGFAEGADLAIGLATVGIVAGIVTGIILVNWGHKTQKMTVRSSDEADVALKPDAIELDDAAHQPTPQWAQHRWALKLMAHAGYIALSIMLGWLLLRALVLIEQNVWARDGGLELMTSLPLFPLAMLGGVLVQYFLTKAQLTKLIDRQIINKIGAYALDALIIAAVATVSLSVLGAFWVPFMLIAVAGIAWNIFAFLVLAKRLIPHYWFERGIGDYGQSMGMTATGLLLMRVTDPKNDSRALESFGYKQLFFEPVVGGGIFTASSLILIAEFGLVAMLIFTSMIMSGWLVAGFVQRRKLG